MRRRHLDDRAAITYALKNSTIPTVIWQAFEHQQATKSLANQIQNFWHHAVNLRN
jgi:mannosyltransferase OCH1-like enzyme